MGTEWQLCQFCIRIVHSLESEYSWVLYCLYLSFKDQLKKEEVIQAPDMMLSFQKKRHIIFSELKRTVLLILTK